MAILNNNVTVQGLNTNVADVNADITILASTNLDVNKTVIPTTAKVGDNLLYTITIKNTGTHAATNVVVSDTVDPGVVFDSAIIVASDASVMPVPTLTATTLNVTIPIINAGVTVTIIIVAHVV